MMTMATMITAVTTTSVAAPTTARSNVQPDPNRAARSLDRLLDSQLSSSDDDTDDTDNTGHDIAVRTYEVQAVTDVNGGSVLVQWVGFPPAYEVFSWEPIGNVKHLTAYRKFVESR